MKYLIPRPLRLLCVLLLLSAVFGVARQLAQTTLQTPAANAVANERRRTTRGNSPARETAVAEARVRASYGQLPLSFEANQGQTAAPVKFLARNNHYNLFLTADEAVLALERRTEDAPTTTTTARRAKAQKSAPEKRASANSREAIAAVLRLKLEGANRSARVHGLEEMPGRSNYLTGNDPRGWRKGVPNYGRVEYESIYKGVDLVYYGNDRQLEFDFNVAPAHDPGVIRLSFKGARHLKLDAQGDLRLTTPAGELRQHKPVAYQLIDGRRREVACAYVLDERSGGVSFKLGAYDRSRALVIDPVLSYATYLGGNNTDEANAVAVDAQGNTYVVGTTLSMNFPRTPGAFQSTLGGTVTATYDAFVTKLNPEGTSVVYSTFLGGYNGDNATSVVVNANGEAHLAGETSSPNFPVANPYQPARRGNQDVFVTKLNSDGTGLLYSTFLGGSQNEYAPVLALANDGNIVVAGRTFSVDFPTHGASLQPYFGGNCPAAPCSDGFITKLHFTYGVAFSTFLGGRRDDFIDGIAIANRDGSIYVTGRTNSTDFPTTPVSLRPSKTGNADSFDAFVVRLNSAGLYSYFSTYLGGSGDDYAYDIAVDDAGDAWVTGLTGSSDFPTTPDAFQSTLRGAGAYAFDAFLTKLDARGDLIDYSTYLGGDQDDVGIAVATDGLEVYWAGQTASRDLSVTPDAFQPNHGGGAYDAFLARLVPDQPSLNYLSYLGGSDTEYLRALAVAQVNGQPNLYVVGSTHSLDFHTTPGVVQAYAGSQYQSDGFVARVNMGAAGYIVSGRVTNEYGNGLTDVEITITDGAFYKIVRTHDDGTYSIGGIPAGASLTLTARREVFVFEPSNVVLENIASNREVNFTGAAPLVIKGRITDPNGNGRSVSLELTGAVSLSAQSDDFGYYRFARLPAGGTYTVTPRSDPWSTYSPPSRTVEVLNGDQVFNFTQLPPPSISGRIIDSNGQPRYCTVTLRDAEGAFIQERYTDADGRYEFFPLFRGRSYSVTPSINGTLYTFTPETRAFNDLQSGQTADFTALPPIMINGRITNRNGDGVMTTVTLSGTINRTTESNYDGRYSFYELPRGGNYTVAPSMPGTFWTFTPTSQSVTNAQQEMQTFNFTAVPPLHLTGQITDEYGNGLSDVEVRVTGTLNQTVHTDGAGWYSFPALQRGGTYTVTPSHELYNFTPANPTFNDVNEDRFVNFTAALRRYRIGGRVTDASGAGLGNATLELAGAQSATTQTDTGGNYAFENLRVGQSYTVRAARAGWSFAPEVFAANDLRADETANFNATRLAYAISGRVLDAGDGSALSGVQVALGGSRTATTTTDATGNYAFTNLPSEGTYTITPTHRYYNVAPQTRTFDNLLANQDAPFNATRINYSISGHVGSATGAALSGVAVNLSGARTRTAYTDASGNYTFNDLPSGNSYTVTPSATHYAFTPQARTFDNLDSSSTADFTAALLRHNIAGRVVDANGNGIGGVDVNLGGAQASCVVTDAGGNYAFASLPAGGSYTVSVFHPWYGFAPATQSFNDLGGDRSANFTGTLLTFRISGQMTEGAAVVSGASVSLTGSQSATAQTDANGYYSFNVSAGGTYTVTPAHPYFILTPASATFTALSIHQTANFSAARRTYALSGYARDACNRAVAAVSVTLARAGATSVSVQTDANGFYSFAGVPAGYSYMLTPAKTAYNFNPSSASLPNLNGNLSANFTGTPTAATPQLAPLADAYVRGGTSAASNFGTTAQLISRLASSASNTYESYLTFEVGQQCTITSVKLRLYGKLSSGSNLAVSVYSVANTAWTETGINWNNKPTAGSLLATANILNTTAAFYDWDITNYVRGEMSAGRTRITVALKNSASTNNDATFNSRQATTNQPRLLITTP
ncbi:MAG TPA: carboxypeptidase regulatory-like domain-containing protein [Pyrinomonadaceae bacterium]|jgi:hypothetical protein